MLKAICIVSANDCVVAMAEYISGSEEAFVEKMNEKAKQLGMNDTCFKNCHGIDEDGHVTSSYDIALMSRELLCKHPGITNYTTVYMDTLRGGTSELVNTNKLIRNYNGATGLKTGSTSLALFNLSASATRDDLSLIAVVMKAPTSNLRFQNAKQLLDYGFKNYEYKRFANKGEVVRNLKVSKEVKDNTNAVFDEDVGILVKKGSDNEIIQKVELVDNKDVITAPVEKQQKVGTVSYISNGKTIRVVDIVAEEKIDKKTLYNTSKNIYKEWFNLCR